MHLSWSLTTASHLCGLLLDVSGAVKLGSSENYELFAAIDNLFDTPPPDMPPMYNDIAGAVFVSTSPGVYMTSSGGVFESASEGYSNPNFGGLTFEAVGS